MPDSPEWTVFEAPEEKGVPTQPYGNTTDCSGVAYLSMLLGSQGLVTETCQLVEARRRSPLPFALPGKALPSRLHLQEDSLGQGASAPPSYTLEGPKPIPQFLPSIASRGRSTPVSEEQTT